MFGFLKPKPKPKPKKMAAPLAPMLMELDLGQERVSVEVGFDRFRSLRLRIRPDGTVRARAPMGASLAALREHLLSKGPWILKHLERLRARRQSVPSLQYVNGETHTFLGQDYALVLRQGPRNLVRLAGDGLLVTTRREPEPELVRKLVESWLLSQAREVFTKTIRELLPRMDALGAPRPAKLNIRCMRSRWGSCSRARAICLNRQLIKAPLSCIEFVAAHELCHLLHHSHDARFYAVLDRVMPDWRARKELLHSLPIL
ncbi:MAG TPA: SprT family zinc-dependent metalloprotease [Humidesulfovibrio sp.]|uniref:M48 family metallopeptidase n=1 Tax=Humidesulfovibrio sp. TaxID=2910988 RepID=UPI002BF5E543|nr:SprT family zinc-dependent metalloprotease [Humidesulfovibrio sp.]HWR02882.1 SprT family zinc-dependent metalloprotease [Humidesulfovibrio sp.]